MSLPLRKEFSIFFPLFSYHPLHSFKNSFGFIEEMSQGEKMVSWYLWAYDDVIKYSKIGKINSSK